MSRVLAFDPGTAESGVSAHDTATGRWFFATVKRPADGKDLLDRGLAAIREDAGEGWGPQSAVVENYHAQPWRGGKPPLAGRAQVRLVESLIGALAEGSIPTVLQSSELLPSMPESDLMLVLAQAKAARTNRHERAAARHILIYLGRKSRQMVGR